MIRARSNGRVDQRDHMVHPAPTIDFRNRVSEQVPGDLFERAGISLVDVRPPQRTEDAQARFVVTRISGTLLTLHTNVRLYSPAKGSERCRPVQLHLDLRASAANVTRCIPQSHSAFMSMRVTSYFADSKDLYPAAQQLVRVGVLYLGDVARMTSGETATALGRFAGKLDSLLRELQDVDIHPRSSAPWWARPTDFYAR